MFTTTLHQVTTLSYGWDCQDGHPVFICHFAIHLSHLATSQATSCSTPCNMFISHGDVSKSQQKSANLIFMLKQICWCSLFIRKSSISPLQLLPLHQALFLYSALLIGLGSSTKHGPFWLNRVVVFYFFLIWENSIPHLFFSAACYEAYIFPSARQGLIHKTEYKRQIKEAFL